VHGRPTTREDVWCRGFYETQVSEDVRAYMVALAEAGLIEEIG
jgi:hypothetical protein